MAELLDRLQRALHSSYILEREIGRGGMATVYLARDIKHDRRVAVKMLNPELGAILGTERFLSEIKVTANLQHPNLLPLFDSGDAEGHLYYVMPFVEGESLRVLLDREKQLPIDEALRIAIAVGRALDYAHSHGVVHRDLKPENILMQHGQPVVSDFGIALAISNAGGSRITQTGLSLGTPQYMSPEQATGDRTIDGRSDIYSLGAILYEMLVGEPPHSGSTVQATIAKVITDPVRPLRLTRTTIPRHVDAAVQKALAKLPADRFPTAGQFVHALETDTSSETGAVSSVGSPGRRSWIRHPASAALLGALVLAAAGGAYLLRQRVTTDARVVRFTLTLPMGNRVRDAFGVTISMSPDGKSLAYVGESPRGSQLWIRDLARGVSRALPGTDDAESPVFTNDGRWILFRINSRSRLVKVSVDGGPPEILFPVLAPSRIAFYGNDSLIFSNAGAIWPHLYRSSLAGGTPQRFLRDDSTTVSQVQANPSLAPDGRTVFFSSATDNRQFGRMLAYTTLESRTITVTDIQAYTVLGYAAGRIIYSTDAGAIMALGFDLSSHRIIGQPVSTGEIAQIDVYLTKAFLSAGGDLILVGDAGPSRPLLIGKSGPSTPLLKGERVFADTRYSPDGRHVALTIREAGRADVWIYSVESGSLDRLSNQGAVNDRPEWSPDSKRVLYRTNRDGPTSLWWQPIDGSGPAERLTPQGLGTPVLEGVLTPDGKTLVYRIDTQTQLRDIMAIRLDGDRKQFPVLATEFDELAPRISPDGKWMAYVSTESGRDEVYVRAFPGPGGRTLVSGDGGGEPLWSRDSRRILYRKGNAILSASMSPGNPLTVARRDTVLTGTYYSNRFHPGYDIAPDGRLLVLESTQMELQPTIVLNWAASLAAKLGPVK